MSTYQIRIRWKSNFLNQIHNNGHQMRQYKGSETKHPTFHLLCTCCGHVIPRNIFGQIFVGPEAIAIYLRVSNWKQRENTNYSSLSRVVRKPAFCIWENKDADQLRGNRAADQRLCFRFIDSTIPFIPKYENSSL